MFKSLWVFCLKLLLLFYIMLRKLYNNSKELFIVDTVIGYLSSQHVLPQYFLCNILEFSASGSLALYREQDIGVELPRRNITSEIQDSRCKYTPLFWLPWRARQRRGSTEHPEKPMAKEAWNSLFWLLATSNKTEQVKCLICKWATDK